MTNEFKEYVAALVRGALACCYAERPRLRLKTPDVQARIVETVKAYLDLENVHARSGLELEHRYHLGPRVPVECEDTGTVQHVHLDQSVLSSRHEEVSTANSPVLRGGPFGAMVVAADSCWSSDAFTGAL